MRPHTLVFLLLLASLAGPGCEGGSTDGPDAGVANERDGGGRLDPAEAASLFVQRAVGDWEGVDYSHARPDGRTDSDGDGEVDANDAVIVVETLRALGYDVPPTIVQGLHDGFHTTAGYAQDPAGDYQPIELAYTRPSEVTEAALKARDWSGLAEGDLLFVDHDQDFLWDTAAVYLGAWGGHDHAALQASDYYDEARVVDLDDESEVLSLDIQYGYASVRTLDFATLQAFR